MRWAVIVTPLAPLAALSLFFMLSAGACSSSNAKPASDEGSRDEFSGETRDTSVKHEPCEPSGHTVKTYKADDPLSSSKPFVTHVFSGSQELCSFADLNGDGRIDVYSYFGPDGRIRRRESAYSVDKAVDEIATYEGGELKLVARETNFDGKIDTWDYYEGGKLSRRERDKNGDGRLDEWWTFEPGTENATIVGADARTGKPDPTQTIKLGLGFKDMSKEAAPAEWKKAKPDAGADAPKKDTGPATPVLTPDDPMGTPDTGSTDAGKDAGKKAPK